MPLEGETNFKGLKKSYAKGIELRGKTLGIILPVEVGSITLKGDLSVINTAPTRYISLNGCALAAQRNSGIVGRTHSTPTQPTT